MSECVCVCVCKCKCKCECVCVPVGVALSDTTSKYYPKLPTAQDVQHPIHVLG